MSEQTPEQQMMQRIESLGYTINSLQSDVRLTGLRDEVEDLDTQINGLRPCIQDLREQGYVFGKGFEAQADGYASQWQALKPRIFQEIDRQAPMLENQLRPFEDQYAQVRARANSPAAVQPAVDRLDSQLDSLGQKVSAVKSSVESMYDSLESEAGKFKASLDRLAEMLQRFAEAAAVGSFGLLPTEGAVMAVKATYSRDEKMDKDDPQGYLFLTDQRLIFEQNQEVATKKVLFITTEKQKVQKLIFEAPVALVEQAEASKKGLFGHEDHLALRFKSGAPVYQTWFHLDGQDCNEWQAMIGQARSHGFENDRAVAVDQVQVDKVKAAPTQCPNCGAPFTQVVLRGMDSLNCEYCQHVIRL
jgi:predicted  nucleic acid-binding Zn-ribbon protein